MTSTVVPGTSAVGGFGLAVLGMHRSGTSIVTKVLHDLGGRTCDSAELLSGNEHGQRIDYWESRSLVGMNEALLRAFGGDWAAPPTLKPGWWSSAPATKLAPRASALFWSVHAGDGWLCKDPRLCLTLPFWRAWVMPQVHVVLVVRHPEDVAASLARRDGIDRRYGLWLYERYTWAALRACEGLATMVLSYDRLSRDPLATGALLQRWAFPDGAAGTDRLRDAVSDVRRESPTPGPAGRPHPTALYEVIEGMHGCYASFPALATPRPEAKQPA